MKPINKWSVITSIIYYTLSAFCLIIFAKLGMYCVTLVKFAVNTPDALFTNKFLYIQIMIMLCMFGILFICLRTFENFCELGYFYWTIGFKKGENNGNTLNNNNAKRTG